MDKTFKASLFFFTFKEEFINFERITAFPAACGVSSTYSLTFDFIKEESNGVLPLRNHHEVHSYAVAVHDPSRSPLSAAVLSGVSEPRDMFQKRKQVSLELSSSPCRDKITFFRSDLFFFSFFLANRTESSVGTA